MSVWELWEEDPVLFIHRLLLIFSTLCMGTVSVLVTVHFRPDKESNESLGDFISRNAEWFSATLLGWVAVANLLLLKAFSFYPDTFDEWLMYHPSTSDSPAESLSTVGVEKDSSKPDDNRSTLSTHI